LNAPRAPTSELGSVFKSDDVGDKLPRAVSLAMDSARTHPHIRKRIGESLRG
jgi:hypothetical protein